MEQKTVLAIRDDSALFLFKRDGEVEFVVGYLNGPAHVGDVVESWANGHYFNNLEDGLKYLKSRNY